jgi:hypothetical protein
MSALLQLAERCEKAAGPDRELDAAIMFDLFAKPVGEHKADGGPTAYLWPEDSASWSFGIRFPGKGREWFTSGNKRKDFRCAECGTHDKRETLLIERDGALVLMNELRVPPVTASLEAAMQLAPESDGQTLVFWRSGNDGESGNPESFKAEVLVCTGLTSKSYTAVADTEPLARCAAFLRARAAS